MPPKDSKHASDVDQSDEPDQQSSEQLADELKDITTSSDIDKTAISKAEDDQPTKDQIIKMGRDIATTLYVNSPTEAEKILIEIQDNPENSLELEIIDLLGSIQYLPGLQAEIDRSNDHDKVKRLKKEVLTITKGIRNFIMNHGDQVGMIELIDWTTRATMAGQVDAVRYSPGLLNKGKNFASGIIRGIAGELAISRLFSDRTGAHHQVDLASVEQDLSGTDLIIHSLSQPNKTIHVDVKTQPVITDAGSSANGQDVPVDQAICRRNHRTGREQIWIHPDSLADDYQIHPAYEADIYKSIIDNHRVLL